MKLNIPVVVDFNYIILDLLKGITAEKDDYMYMQGFYDCRDEMISAIESVLDNYNSINWSDEE